VSVGRVREDATRKLLPWNLGLQEHHSKLVRRSPVLRSKLPGPTMHTRDRRRRRNVAMRLRLLLQLLNLTPAMNDE